MWVPVGREERKGKKGRKRKRKGKKKKEKKKKKKRKRKRKKRGEKKNRMRKLRCWDEKLSPIKYAAPLVFGAIVGRQFPSCDLHRYLI